MKDNEYLIQKQKTERLRKALEKTSFSQQKTMLMFSDWEDLLQLSNRNYDKESLIYALAIRYPELNVIASERLTELLNLDYRKNPLNSGSLLYVMGNTGLKKTEIKDILKETDIKYSTIANQATHILIGKSISESDLSVILDLLPECTLLTEPIFFDFCSELRAMDNQNPEAFRQLLLHEDDSNVEIGLDILKSSGSPIDFLTEIFGIYLFSKNSDIVGKAEKLLKVYGSAVLKSRMSKVRKEILTADFEQWLKKSGLNIGSFYRIAYLKEPRTVSYFNRAVQYLSEVELDSFLDEAIRSWAFYSKPQHISVPSEIDFERFAGKIYQCSGLKELTVNIQSQKFLKILPQGIAALSELERLIIAPSFIEFPMELQRLPKLKSLFINSVHMVNMDNVFAKGFESLEYLRLHLCRLNKLPKGMGFLENLKVLDLSGGDLRELSPELRLLRNLEELNLENNKFDELPEILFLMSKLKKLKLKNRWSASDLRNIETLKMSLPNCEIGY